MEPSLNTWTSIFLIASAQGFFLSFAIFSRRSAVNNLLGFLMLVFSICLLYYVAYWTSFYIKIPQFFGVIQGTTYLMGPLAYFYIRSERNKIYFKPLHFLPFLFYIIFFSGIHFLNRSGLRIVLQTQIVIQNLHLLFYSFLSYYRTLKNKARQNGEDKKYIWRKKITLCFTGYSLAFLLYYILVWTGTLKIEYDYIISIVSSFLIYYIGYYGYVHPEVFKLFETGKYEKSSLSHSAAISILDVVKKYFEINKTFLESDLKMDDIAGNLNLSSHHISQAINELEHINFSEFVNRYRIEEAKKMLSDQEQHLVKIIDIAYVCGFNNKASFNNSFRKQTGMSPKEYKNSMTEKFRLVQTQNPR